MTIWHMLKVIHQSTVLAGVKCAVYNCIIVPCLVLKVIHQSVVVAGVKRAVCNCVSHVACRND